MTDFAHAHIQDEPLRLAQHARRQLLTAIRTGASLAAAPPPAPEVVTAAFNEARTALDDQARALAVIGYEGAGKSMFINALLGAAVCPESRKDPGTVAPVVVEYGASPCPTYRVEIANGRPSIACADTNEFSRYILQRENPGNRLQVRAGRVAVKHRLLVGGAVMIDMPGLKGVSASVSAESERYIRRRARSLIVVVRERDYRDMGKHLRRLVGMGKAICAVVSNWETGAWREAEEGDATAWIEEAREAVRRYLNSEGEGISIPAEWVFVLHLPSLRARSEKRSPAVDSQAHDGESVRFIRYLSGLVESHGAAAFLKQAANYTERAFNLLEEHAQRRVTLITKIITAPHPANPAAISRKSGMASTSLDQLMKISPLLLSKRAASSPDITRYLQAACERWRESSSVAAILRAFEGEWESLRRRAMRGRDEVNASINAVTSRIAKSNNITESDCVRYRKMINDTVKAVAGELVNIQAQALGRAWETLCERANLVLRRLYADFPLSLLEVEVNSPPSSLRAEIVWDYPNTYVLWDWFSRRASAYRIATNYRDVVANKFDTSANGYLRQKWEEKLNQCCEEADALVAKKMSALLWIYVWPSRYLERLEALLKEAEAKLEDTRQGRMRIFELLRWEAMGPNYEVSITPRRQALVHLYEVAREVLEKAGKELHRTQLATLCSQLLGRPLTPKQICDSISGYNARVGAKNPFTYRRHGIYGLKVWSHRS